MKVSNVYNLPEFLVAVANKDKRPDSKVIRVTQLINPPLVRRLNIEKWDDIKVDAAESLYATLGTGIHMIQEKYVEEDVQNETTLAWEVDGYIVEGTCDIYNKKTCFVEDLKVTTVRAMSFINTKPEYIEQLNCYAWLLRKHDYPVHGIRLRALFRDWHLKDAAVYKKKDYPAVPYAWGDMPLWSIEEADGFVAKRVKLHKEAQEKSYEAIECTDEEKWARPDQWAVHTSQARARRLLDTFKEAQAYQANMKPQEQKKSWIDHREGTVDRCTLYCNVRSVCPFAKTPHLF